MNFDICVFGGCSLDMIFYQKKDGTYDNAPDKCVPGGKGSNQAIAASRAGAKTVMISRIGKDAIGKKILDNLEYNGIDTSGVEEDETIENEYSLVKIRYQDKDNEIERHNGAIDNFTEDMIDTYQDLILNSKIIVCQLKGPKEVTEKLIDFCYQNNKKLILTPCHPTRLSISNPKNLALIDKIFIITCNQKECETIFNTDDIESCIRKYPNKLIVTLGKDGLMYYDGTEVVKMPAIETQVVDTVGAGDTLAGNLAANLAKGLTLNESLKKATYASAMKIDVETAQAGMPYLEELEKFIAEKEGQKKEF